MLAGGRGKEGPGSSRVGEEELPCSWADGKRRCVVEGRKGHVIQGLGGHSGKKLRSSEVAGNEDRQKMCPKEN